MLAFAVVSLVVCVTLLAWTLSGLVDAKRSQRWPSVLGTLDAAYALGSNGDGSYEAYVAYRYIVDGVEFEGDRLTNFHYSMASETRLERVLDRFREQQQTLGGVWVYYDPVDPATAVLWPGVRLMHAFGVAVFLVLTLGSVAWIYFAL